MARWCSPPPTRSTTSRRLRSRPPAAGASGWKLPCPSNWRQHWNACIRPRVKAEEAQSEARTPLEEDAERLKDLASEAPVIRLVNQIITRAVETNASDIHVEPFEDRLRVRYRYDGVLHEADNPPIRLAAAITSRIKIMARLDIAERRLPQDGRIRLAVRGQEIDFRVSTVPSLHGETVVLRILDRAAVAFDYAKLGLPPAVIDRFQEALALPNGIVLVTGPTGSGKTTTLYTGLLALNSIERKIVTVEDPIEYRLHGITQMQVHEQIGLTFAEFLSAIVRQDPGRDHGRRNPQSGDRTGCRPGRAARTIGAVDAAHQLRRRRGDAAAGHGVGGLSAGGSVAWRAGATACAAALSGVPPPGAGASSS